MTQVSSNETHISAQQTEARPHTRFSRTDGDQSRASRVEASSRERPREADAVTKRAFLDTAPRHPGSTSSRGIRFTRDNRLLDAAAFGRVFKGAKRSRDRLFTVLCKPNDSHNARLGLAISKKHCRKATARNRIKRIVRESFRQQQVQLAGLDIVVINQPAAATASNRQVFDSLGTHWEQCRRVATAGK